MYIFDDKGRVAVDFKVKDAPPHAKVLATEHIGSSVAELSMSQLVYWQKVGLAHIAVVFGSAESPLTAQDFVEKFLAAVRVYFDSNPSLSLFETNAATILMLLDQMLDDGVPVVTEGSLLAGLVPNSWGLNSLLGSQEMVTWDKPWRATAVQHSRDEIFVDIVEKLTLEVCPRQRKSKKRNASAFMSGTFSMEPMFCTVDGVISVLSRLSGDPRVQIDLQFDQSIQPEFGFHPCVEQNLWFNQHLLAFNPPDGRSTIAEYSAEISNPGLVLCDLKTGLGTEQTEFELRVSTLMDTQVKGVDGLSITLELPPGAKSVKESRITAGDLVMEDGKQVWVFGDHTPMGWNASLRGTVIADTVEFPLYAKIEYTLLGRVPSKVAVKGIHLPGWSKQKPYKGVRFQTGTNSYVVRP